MSFESIRLTREDDFAVLTLANPERRNALAESVIREILAALREVAGGDARGLVVAAEGPVFSAGHDFADMDGRKLPEMQRLLDVCAEMMQLVQSMPQPVIAQVEGLATAAGCQLVSSCDLAVCGRSSRFAVPGGRGGWFCTTPGVALARAVGRKHALEMLLTGDPIDAETAHAWGLVNRVVEDGEVARETRALLARATRGSRLAKATGKRAFYRQIDLDTRAAYDHAGEVMAAASQTEDAQEGLRAFLEKRKPDFRDR